MRIGLDLGGTKLEGIILNDDGSLAQVIRHPTPAQSYPAILDLICEVVDTLQAQAGKTLTVGLGIPGALALPAQRVKNSNATAINDQPLLADLTQRLGYPVRIENDANCLTLSEACYGAAQDAHTVFGVILGTGTGGGIVVNRTLLTGINQIGGEWGHNCMPVAVRETLAADRACYCGRRNCLETVLAGYGLRKTYAEQTGADLDAIAIAELAQQGDAGAQACLELYCQQLAQCLATVVNLLDPDTIVLGGGLSNIPLLYERVPALLADIVFTDDMHTRVVPAQYGDASGARGAACLWPLP